MNLLRFFVFFVFFPAMEAWGRGATPGLFSAVPGPPQVPQYFARAEIFRCFGWAGACSGVLWALGCERTGRPCARPVPLGMWVSVRAQLRLRAIWRTCSPSCVASSGVCASL